MQSYMIESHSGGQGGFEIVMRPATNSGSGTTLEVGARIAIDGGAGKLTADLFAATARHITPETWNHVALVVSQDSAVLYLNASAVASASVIGTPWDGSGIRVGMGEPSAWTGGWFRGSVDELAVYGKALPHVRIAKHFTSLMYQTEAAPQGGCTRYGTHDRCINDRFHDACRCRCDDAFDRLAL